MKSEIKKIRKGGCAHPINPSPIKGCQMSDIGVFGHYLRDWSFIVSYFLHDDRRQWKASFAYDISGKNLNPETKG